VDHRLALAVQARDEAAHDEAAHDEAAHDEKLTGGRHDG
jgi:hypothetical protein